jgi:hypothetical protein
MVLHCPSCDRVLADDAEAVERLGLYVHEGANPSGERFRFASYAVTSELAVKTTTNLSSEWSWFPRYQWQVVRCLGCAEHVGWRFHKHDDEFFALILEHLPSRE